MLQFKKKESKDFYDIPGGKIEKNETSLETSIREFKEETGMDILSQTYKGNVIVEYPNRIFDFDIYIAWIVNTFLDNFYKDKLNRYATGV